MKYKMSDVFASQIKGKLTVGNIRKDLYQDIDLNMIDVVAKFETEDHAKYAAHAINSHDRLTAQVDELKEMLEKLTARGVEYLNDEDINDDEDRAAIESNFNDKILESRKLLTRIGEDNA